MSIPDINALCDDLLVELAKLKATNGSPRNLMDVCRSLRPEIDWKAHQELARSAGWLFVKSSPPLAKRVPASNKTGTMLLAMTAAGKSEASRLYVAKQKSKFVEHLKAIPIGKGLWDLVKIGFGIILGVAATKYFGS